MFLVIGLIICSVHLFSKAPINDRVKVIRNKAEPLYGHPVLSLKEEVFFAESPDEDLLLPYIQDIALNSKGQMLISTFSRVLLVNMEGKLLKRIGRKGPGPGEYRSISAICIDKGDNFYLKDTYTIHQFDPRGHFLRQIKILPSISHRLPRFYVDPDGYVFAFKSGHVKGGLKKKLLKYDRAGNIVKEIIEFADHSAHIASTKMSHKAYHEYMEDFYMVSILDRQLCFGKNLEYKLYISDLNGNITEIITVDEPVQKIGSGELARFRERYGKSRYKELIFPPHRPFFQGLLSDEKGRIYVIHTKSVLRKGTERTVDIIGQNGRFLYRTTVPYYPLIIHDGAIYVNDRSKDDLNRIKKIIIKNYNSLKYK